MPGEDVEIGIDGPLIVISIRTRRPRRRLPASAILTFTSNTIFVKEREGQARPAVTISFAVELQRATRASSSARISGLHAERHRAEIAHRQNDVAAKRWRCFAGNTSTGEVGIRTRGYVS